MKNQYSLKEAQNLKQCPVCNHKLINSEKQTELIFYTAVERDSITHFQCPSCKNTFLRKEVNSL